MNAHDVIQHNESLAPQVSDLLGRVGRAHIPGFLAPEAAEALLTALRDVEWRTVTHGAKGTYDLKPSELDALSDDLKKKLFSAVHAQARDGFQFLFDSYRISDEFESGALSAGPLAEFFEAWNSETCLSFLRALTGEPRVAYSDAQATRYRPGHFLTEHDDDVEGKNRLYAYVLNLTPVWRSDWGGLLMFPGEDGHILEAYTPKFGALNILRVPQAHAVSAVAPFAGGSRYSITGWMRSVKPDPGGKVLDVASQAY
jgi:SM-20-related protein